MIGRRSSASEIFLETEPIVIIFLKTNYKEYHELNSKSMLEINGGSEETTDVTISFVNPRNPLTTSLCKTMDAQIPMNWFKYHIELNNFSKYNVN